jgi:hypothetical protein
VATRPRLTSVIQQPLSYVLPDCLWSGQPDGVGFLNLDGSAVASTGYRSK